MIDHALNKGPWSVMKVQEKKCEKLLCSPAYHAQYNTQIPSLTLTCTENVSARFGSILFSYIAYIISGSVLISEMHQNTHKKSISFYETHAKSSSTKSNGGNSYTLRCCRATVKVIITLYKATCCLFREQSKKKKLFFAR